MATYVCSGAEMKCSMGTATSKLIVTPRRKVNLSGKPQATIMDAIPNTNIPPFGLCTSLANPVVAAATAAHLGVLTPMPCLPCPTGTWVPGKTDVLEKGEPALLNTCKLPCQWLGMIELMNDGQ